jgi:hypothetical protein
MSRKANTAQPTIAQENWASKRKKRLDCYAFITMDEASGEAVVIFYKGQPLSLNRIAYARLARDGKQLKHAGQIIGTDITAGVDDWVWTDEAHMHVGGGFTPLGQGDADMALQYVMEAITHEEAR